MWHTVRGASGGPQLRDVPGLGCGRAGHRVTRVSRCVGAAGIAGMNPPTRRDTRSNPTTRAGKQAPDLVMSDGLDTPVVIGRD